MTETLHAELLKQVADLSVENSTLSTEVKILSLQVKELQRQLFGCRSDRRTPKDDPAQGTLEGLEEELWQQEPEALKRPRRPERTGRKKGPKPLSPDLPRVEEQVADPELDKLICPVTGKLMKIGFVESLEALSRQPARFFVRLIRRNVFVSPSGEAPVYAPWPREVMSKSRIDTTVVATLITGRFADHQPYHRQQGQLARLGVDLAANTMVSLVRQASEKLEPLYKYLQDQVLRSGYIQLDPTTIRLISDQKRGSTKEACIWTYRALGPPAVFFKFTLTKQGIHPAATLKHYRGILQTDGASNFGGVTTRPAVIHLGCWAHLRRYFVKAEQAGLKAASPILEHIDRLFYLERIAQRWKIKPVTVMALRQKHSQPLIEKIFANARDYAAAELMVKTPMATAVNYLLTREISLRECFAHAPSRIDNNLAENALRPIKLGQNNWLFVGHPDAGPRAAIIFTIVENCRRAGINPEAFLADVLARIDDHPASRIGELSPFNWAKTKHGDSK